MEFLNELVESILSDPMMENYRDEPGLKEMLAREIYLTYLRIIFNSVKKEI